MSRHKIPAKDTKHNCVVGYDRGMKTFFAQVEDSEIERLASEAAERVADAYSHNREPSDDDAEACEREAIIFWIGADTIGQVPTVEFLAEAVAPYAEIAPEIIERLKADQIKAESAPRTGHEQATQEFIIANSLR